MYAGERPDLTGMTALVRDDPEDAEKVLVQFDDAPVMELCFGWHPFPREAFQEYDRSGEVEPTRCRWTNPVEKKSPCKLFENGVDPDGNFCRMTGMCPACGGKGEQP